ncbi:MAG TPA: archaeosortase/exosortase family protein [Myxococcales bacterium]|jgi:exosortase/archaeosortase family protein
MGLTVLAAVHAALALRTGGLTYEIPVVIAWLGVLLVQGERRQSLRATSAEQVCGTACIAFGMGVAALFSAKYRAPLRLTALGAGFGYLLARHGLRGAARSGRELCLLLLPVLVPPPSALQAALEPQFLSVRFTAVILDVLGHPATIAGDVISIPGGAARVLAACCGLNSMSQLGALGILVACLFEMSAPRKLAVVVASVVAGFAANCGRLALLVILSQRDVETFELWHGTTGELRFTCLGLAVASLAFWLVVREPARETAAA